MIPKENGEIVNLDITEAEFIETIKESNGDIKKMIKKNIE